MRSVALTVLDKFKRPVPGAKVAVEAFLNGRLNFLDIAGVTEHVLTEVQRRNGPARLTTLEEVVAADQEARRLAAEAVAARAAA